MVAGNAFGVPLLEQLKKKSYRLSHLKFIVAGAVAMSRDVKVGLMKHLPGVQIIENVGATESGSNMSFMGVPDGSRAVSFTPSSDTLVLRADKRGPAEIGDSEVGWLARSGNIPLGYLGDPKSTSTLLPTIKGVRYSVPGDRARRLNSGGIELVGRDAVTINSGGEKVFAEEVEAILAEIAEVRDAVVIGRAHPRWGEEVVAIVQLSESESISEEAIRQLVSKRLAKYKVPRRVFFVQQVQRNQMGKLDYQWARGTVNSES
jgi:acyl-CoA synthetase (AMP-forming)/AMP-acid ligase II